MKTNDPHPDGGTGLVVGSVCLFGTSDPPKGKLRSREFGSLFYGPEKRGGSSTEGRTKPRPLETSTKGKTRCPESRRDRLGATDHSSRGGRPRTNAPGGPGTFHLPHYAFSSPHFRLPLLSSSQSSPTVVESGVGSSFYPYSSSDGSFCPSYLTRSSRLRQTRRRTPPPSGGRVRGRHGRPLLEGGSPWCVHRWLRRAL